MDREKKNIVIKSEAQSSNGQRCFRYPHRNFPAGSLGRAQLFIDIKSIQYIHVYVYTARSHLHRHDRQNRVFLISGIKEPLTDAISLLNSGVPREAANVVLSYLNNILRKDIIRHNILFKFFV